MNSSCVIVPYIVNDVMVGRLPLENSRQLPSRSQVMVSGTVNGQAYSGPIEPDGRGSHWLEITPSMQQAGIRADQPIEVHLQANQEWPEPAIPTDLQAALADNPSAAATWQRCTPMAHWEWLRWIQSTTVPATRQRRIVVSCSKLTAGMRRPCCFNRSLCCVPAVSKTGLLIEPTPTG